LKDAARLLVYLVATLLVGALLAPLLFWSAQGLAARGVLPFLAHYEFERFFHRALLVAAILLLWPLLRSLKIKTWRELGLSRERSVARDLVIGFLIAALPLLLCALELVVTHHYQLRHHLAGGRLLSVLGATVFVPPIEELLFRGLILGILLRSSPRWIAIFFTSALYSILHFLKPSAQSVTVVTWDAGFISAGNSFAQFNEPLLVAAGFTTLFLLGWILADARVRTQALWLPIGLHAGWIFTSGMFGKVARQTSASLPWLGSTLLVGILPLSLGLLTWLLLRLWLTNESARAT
jgi:CAAX protease family protein